MAGFKKTKKQNISLWRRLVRKAGRQAKSSFKWDWKDSTAKRWKRKTGHRTTITQTLNKPGLKWMSGGKKAIMYKKKIKKKPYDWSVLETLETWRGGGGGRRLRCSITYDLVSFSTKADLNSATKDLCCVALLQAGVGAGVGGQRRERLMHRGRTRTREPRHGRKGAGSPGVRHRQRRAVLRVRLQRVVERQVAETPQITAQWSPTPSLSAVLLLLLLFF